MTSAGPPGPPHEPDDLEVQYVGLLIENEVLRGRISAYEGSRWIQIASRALRLAGRILPKGSTLRRLIGRVARLLLRRPTIEQRVETQYKDWLTSRQPGLSDLERQRSRSGEWGYRPLVSVCMPVHDPRPDILNEAISSVCMQSYEHWELCVCDDGSADPSVVDILHELAQSDPRIRVVRNDRQPGISGATNGALALARGEFVGFLDHDDVLAPQTLYRYVEALQSDPDIDLFYCDEDLLGVDGIRRFPFLKPDWSPEVLLSMNYVTHFVVVKSALVQRLGGLRPEYDGAQDYDLVLRLTDESVSVHHVAEVMYSWRQSEISTAMTSEAKPWAYEAGLRALEDTIKRRSIDARVEHGQFPGAYRLRYGLPTPPPHVEIVIPTRDRADLLRLCIESIRSNTGYPNYSITILDNDSIEPATKDLIREAALNVVHAPGPFNYAEIMNRGFQASRSEYVLTLNNDTQVTDTLWIENMLELASQPSVGAVGCQLHYPDGGVQHEGIVVGTLGPAANVAFTAPGIRLIGVMQTNRDVSAVTGACSLIRRSAWEAVGGYEEALPVAYNDVDFCIRLRRAGYRVLYTPFTALIHSESASRGALHPEHDEALFIRRWCREIAAGDSYFPRVLRAGPYGYTLSSEDHEFRGRDLALLHVAHLDEHV